MTKFYISDTHFGHKRLLIEGKKLRPEFSTIEDHDNCIIENWNRVVSDEDDVYFLGDFVCKSKNSAAYYLKQLKGHKHLIKGNHDVKKGGIVKPELMEYFEDAYDILQVKDGERLICLCHYPLAEWPQYYHGCYHFYGHIHNDTAGIVYPYMRNLKDKDGNPLAFNVGVDVIGYAPLTADQIISNPQWQSLKERDEN